MNANRARGPSIDPTQIFQIFFFLLCLPLPINRLLKQSHHHYSQIATPSIPYHHQSSPPRRRRWLGGLWNGRVRMLVHVEIQQPLGFELLFNLILIDNLMNLKILKKKIIIQKS
jgi:hypothetical protein